VFQPASTAMGLRIWKAAQQMKWRAYLETVGQADDIVGE
jgi:hypothetical protein